jgi:hypothetical protein
MDEKKNGVLVLKDGEIVDYYDWMIGRLDD